MDTKLKKYNYVTYGKLIVGILFAASVAAFGCFFLEMMSRVTGYDVIEEKTYQESYQFYDDYYTLTNTAMNLGFRYGGDASAAVEVTEKETWDELRSSEANYGFAAWLMEQMNLVEKSEEIASSESESEVGMQEEERMTSEELQQRQEFKDQMKNVAGSIHEWDEATVEMLCAEYLRENPEIKAIIEEKVANNKANSKKNLLTTLESEPDFYYYIERTSGQICTNLTNEAIKKIQEMPYYVECKNGSTQVYARENPESEKPYRYHENFYDNFSEMEINDAAYFGFSNEFMNQKQQDYEAARQMELRYLGFLLAIFLFGVVCFSYLCIVTGRRKTTDMEGAYEVHLDFVNKIWSEVQVLLVIGLAFTFVLTVREFPETGSLASYIVVATDTGIVCAMAALILSQVRRLKAHSFLKGFIIIRVLSLLWNQSKLMYKAIIFAIGIPLLSATWVGTPIMIAVTLYLCYRIVSDFEEIQKGVQKVKEGDLHYQIPIKGKHELAVLAEDINSLSSGLDSAIASEVKSERMKTELISNVSHDIKTPLTSIITYVDLLKKEELNNQRADEYVEILDNKSQRLKVLTDDLFAAAKASSGAMPVNLDKVDLVALIQQGLGEFSEKLQTAGLEVKTHFPKESVCLLADGQLMWRVLENLLSNVVKYGQKNSRVYVEIEEAVEVRLIMKNISAYELNIPSDELMERFIRGDESRNTEGSGLGLNIAKSLVELQEGKFEIEIDGDLFKVIILLPKYR